MAKVPGPVEIQDVNVDPVLEPNEKLRASLLIMPSWHYTWSVRVRIWMDNDDGNYLEQTLLSVPQKDVLPDMRPVCWEYILSDAMEIETAANIWETAAEQLAEFISLNVRPSYDIGKAAVFKLIIRTDNRTYEAETRESLKDLFPWFNFEG